MNILEKIIIFCIGTSITVMTPLHAMEKFGKQIHASVVLNVDEKGNIIGIKILDQEKVLNILNQELLKSQKPKIQDYQKNYPEPLKEASSDKERALKALKNAASSFAKGIYETTVLIYIAGKLVFVRAGKAAIQILKKIEFKREKKSGIPPQDMPANNNLYLPVEGYTHE